VTRQVFPEVIAALSERWQVIANEGEGAWSADELRARAADCDALYVVAGDRVDQALLDAVSSDSNLVAAEVEFYPVDAAVGAVRNNSSDLIRAI
jgi:hypothetical protein